MNRLAFIAAVIATTICAQQPDESFEVEPAVLPQNLTPDSTAEKSATPAPVVDVATLEKNLERAKKSAASAERLYKMGALAKVEAEARALKVVRIESALEDARLALAKESVLSQPGEKNAAEGPDAAKIETDLAHAIQTAHAAATKRARAELEAAEMDLFRQQKLLALGSGSKAGVRRAEQKLTELKAPKE
jgi:hypothetical protein